MQEGSLFSATSPAFVICRFQEEEKYGMNWETGIDTYMLMILCIKQMVNENPLYGTENSTQCFAIIYNGK